MIHAIPEGFLPQEDRIVHALYVEDNVMIPMNSGGSLFAAAQEVANLGYKEYIRRKELKIKKTDSELMYSEEE